MTASEPHDALAGGACAVREARQGGQAKAGEAGKRVSVGGSRSDDAGDVYDEEEEEARIG